MSTTFTLTGDFGTIVGGESRALFATIRTNLPVGEALVDLDNDVVMMRGPERITLLDDRTFSLTLLATDSTGINVDDGTLRYTVDLRWYDANRAQQAWTSGGFELTADADLSDKAGSSAALPTTPSVGAQIDGPTADNITDMGSDTYAALLALLGVGGGFDISTLPGTGNTAAGADAHASGTGTTASGDSSHAEGDGTEASAQAAHAEGLATTASGDGSHAEGNNSAAEGDYSHAEGQSTAEGIRSHSEGYNSVASGDNSHAEGRALASGPNSHAEGSATIASGDSAHAEGDNDCTASGDFSHAENLSVASGDYSHAEGQGPHAFRVNEHAQGLTHWSGAFGVQHSDIYGKTGNDGGFADIGTGTNPMLLDVHAGPCSARFVIFTADGLNRWDVTVVATNDATDFAGRSTGTVTVNAQSGGSTPTYGSSTIDFTASGNSAGQIVLTPSAAYADRRVHVELYELGAVQ